jgi:hypothetical protein
LVSENAEERQAAGHWLSRYGLGIFDTPTRITALIVPCLLRLLAGPGPAGKAEILSFLGRVARPEGAIPDEYYQDKPEYLAVASGRPLYRELVARGDVTIRLAAFGTLVALCKLDEDAERFVKSQIKQEKEKFARLRMALGWRFIASRTSTPWLLKWFRQAKEPFQQWASAFMLAFTAEGEVAREAADWLVAFLANPELRRMVSKPYGHASEAITYNTREAIRTAQGRVS